MSRFKIFLCSFLCSMLCILPLFLLLLRGGQAAAPVRAEAQGVPVEAPRAGDSCNLLLVTQQQDEPAFLLLRFDALQGKINGAVLPKETIVLYEKQPVLLGECYQTAGPAKARDALSETFSLRIDHYLNLSGETLARKAAVFGTVKMGMSDFGKIKNPDVLRLFSFEGGEINLAPAGAQTLTEEGGLTGAELAVLRAKLYQSFLRAAPRELDGCFTALYEDKGSLTDLTAVELERYHRIFQSFVLQEPEIRVKRMPGSMTQNGYQLSEESAAFTEEYFY